MHTATPSSVSQRPVVRRVALLTLAVVTADQVARAFALGVSEGNPAGAFAARTTRLDLGVSDAGLPTVALLAAIGIIAVGVVGLRRAQAGLLPAWVPGLLIGGAMSTILDRFGAGTIGWVTADRARMRDRA